ncbi:MAG: MGMT family protein [Bacteroidales bacterium]|nr:MGMT family protein [Bacteroidales bacterium]
MEKRSSNRNRKEKSDFFERVYRVAAMIPFGRVTSYGAIAKYLGAGRSSRMVGWAMNNSHRAFAAGEKETIFIPAHRVVNRNGILTGKHHFGNSTTMQQLLENEGAIIENDRILNFSEIFWNPSKEL